MVGFGFSPMLKSLKLQVACQASQWAVAWIVPSRGQAGQLERLISMMSTLGQGCEPHVPSACQSCGLNSFLPSAFISYSLRRSLWIGVRVATCWPTGHTQGFQAAGASRSS